MSVFFRLLEVFQGGIFSPGKSFWQLREIPSKHGGRFNYRTAAPYNIGGPFHGTSLEVIIREQFYSRLRLSGRVPSCMTHHSLASNLSFVSDVIRFTYTHTGKVSFYSCTIYLETSILTVFI